MKRWWASWGAVMQRPAPPDVFELASVQVAWELAERGTGLVAFHRQGVAWYQAVVPLPWHRCRSQTIAYDASFGIVHRCACGAIRAGTPPGRWIEHNTSSFSLGSGQVSEP